MTKFPVVQKTEAACGRYVPGEEAVAEAVMETTTRVIYLNKIGMECAKCGKEVEVEIGPASNPFFQCGCEIAEISDSEPVPEIWIRKK